MPRKASKATIKANLEGFANWKPQVMRKVFRAGVPGAVLEIWNHLHDIESRMESGEAGSCLQSYIMNVARMVDCCETGYYREALPGGGWRTI